MTNFFCHTCNSRIERINRDFTCPTCSTGFIEEVDEDRPRGAAGAAAGGGGGPHQFNPRDFLQLIELDTSQDFPVISFRFGSPNQSNPASPATTTSSSTSAAAATTTTPGSQTQPPGGNGRGPGPGHQRSYHHSPHFSFVVEVDGVPVGGGGMGVNFGEGGASGESGSGEGESQNPFGNMFLPFISDLINGLGGGGQGVDHGGFPFAAGGNINLGDYAWGQGGLDDIVTQLMNAVEGTGPPPLSAKRLSELSRIEITKEQVEGKLQCTVCCEDFSRGENVTRLNCEHIYHNDCILPWLKLHGTCPVCRKDLNSLMGESRASGII